MLPCRNFAAAVERIAQRHPDVPVCLFMGGLPRNVAVAAGRAMTRGERYVPLTVSPFMPIPCVLWPKRKARELLHWARSARGLTRADDGNAGKWIRMTKQRVLVTVPSLVEHDDSQPSVKGGRQHRPWAETWRRAAYLADDALDYEW